MCSPKLAEIFKQLSRVAQDSSKQMLHDGHLESTAAGIPAVPRNSAHGGASGAENKMILPWGKSAKQDMWLLRRVIRR